MLVSNTSSSLIRAKNSSLQYFTLVWKVSLVHQIRDVCNGWSFHTTIILLFEQCGDAQFANFKAFSKKMQKSINNYTQGNDYEFVRTRLQNLPSRIVPFSSYQQNNENMDPLARFVFGMQEHMDRVWESTLHGDYIGLFNSVFSRSDRLRKGT